MKERPILFSGPMVRAILEGRKTQTRRIITPQPIAPVRYDGTALDGTGLHAPSTTHYWEGLNEAGEGNEDYRPFECRYGKASDRLWVRETFYCNSFDYPETTDHARENLLYRADGPHDLEGERVEVEGGGWKPSIHMPRWASRLTLEITGVRVERVQDITEEDAIAEGVTPRVVPVASYGLGNAKMPEIHRLSFPALWNSLNEKRGFGWDKNPWVWVLTFKKVEAGA